MKRWLAQAKAKEKKAETGEQPDCSFPSLPIRSESTSSTTNLLPSPCSKPDSNLESAKEKKTGTSDLFSIFAEQPSCSFSSLPSASTSTTNLLASPCSRPGSNLESANLESDEDDGVQSRVQSIKKRTSVQGANKGKKKGFVHSWCNLPSFQGRQYWSELFTLKNDADILLFPNLKKLFSLLLVLPYSNASVERIFSDLFNIKTDKRNLLKTTNIKAILATKEGVVQNGGCVKFQPTKNMLHCKIWQEN